MKNWLLRIWGSKSGQALIITIILFVFAVILAVAVVLYAYNGYSYASNMRKHIRALEAAESALNFGLYQLNTPGAELPEEIELPDYNTKGEIISWLLNRSPEEYWEEENYRFYLERTASDETYLIGMGRDGDVWRAVRARYEGFNLYDSPAALYVDADTAEGEYEGNAFLIDGRDHDMYGNLISGNDRHGIVTTTEEAADELEPDHPNQKDNIKGADAPPYPSIEVDESQPVDIDDFVERAEAEADEVYYGETHFSGNQTFGSEDDPVIIVVNGELEITGNVEGWGILIVRGEMEKEAGTPVWHGLVVLLPEEEEEEEEEVELELKGTVDIIGAIWMKARTENGEGEAEVELKGNAQILYSAEALQRLASLGASIVRSSWEEL